MSGTFRVRFTLSSISGSFIAIGAGNNASHLIANVTGSYIANYDIQGSNFFLDGSLVGIPFSGLPSGFKPTGLQSLTTPNLLVSDGTFVGSVSGFQGAGESTSGILTYGTYGSVNITNPPGTPDNFTINNIAFTDAIDLINILSITISNVYNGIDSNGGSSVDVIDLIGNYEIQQSQFSPTIENSSIPIRIGDKIKITASEGLDGVEQVILTWTDSETGAHEIVLNIDSQEFWMSIDGVIYWWLNWIILQQPEFFWFYLPFGFRKYKGPVLIKLVGNGTQFSGTVTAGTINILFSDASGIYTLVDSQTNDIIYTRDGITSITNLIMLNIFGDDEIIDDDFFKMLPYPRKILGMINIDEDDIEIENFFRIAIDQDVVIPEEVEIPSPFIKTAFLP